MQAPYHPDLDDYSPFLYSTSDSDLKDPWYSFSADLDNHLSDTSAAPTTYTLSLSYGSSSNSDSDLYDYGGSDELSGSPSSADSSPRSSFDDSTLSTPTSINGDRHETFAPSDFPIPSTCLFAHDEGLLTTSPQTCPSPLVNVSELSNLPSSPTSSRSSSPTVAERTSDCDSDADGESESESEFEIDDSGDSDYDDEDYSPPRTSRKKNVRTTRSRPAPAPRRSGPSRTTRSTRAQRYSPYSSPSPSSSSECNSPRTRSPPLKHTSARKELLSSHTQRIELPSKGCKRWSCPHCTYVQKNHRRPDLKRHIAGHFPDNKFVCCGVPTRLAAHYGVPASAEVSEWQGEEMVGGCWLVFSRRDALIRHLKNEKKDCVNNEVLPEKVL